MSAKVFFDTNILVYCFDTAAPLKREKALALVSTHLDQHTGAISWQVVQEFYNVALHKFKVPLSPENISCFSKEFLMPMCLVYPTESVWKEALLIHQQTQYRFYDSLIVSAALVAGVEILFTEDLQSNRKIQGLEIVNPFLRP